MPVRHRDLAGDDIAPPDPKRCKHCDESRSSCGNESEGSEARESWRVTLDHDLVETLSAIYPEWFKPQSRRDRVASPPSPDEDTFSSSAESEMMNGGSTSGCGSSSSAGCSPAACSSAGCSPAACSPSGCSPAGCSSSGCSPAGCSSAGCSPRVSPPKVVVDDSPLQPLLGKHKESLKVKLMMRRPINQLVAQGIMPPLKTPPAYFEQCKQLERAKTGDLLKAKIQRRPDRQELERRHILEQESHVDPSLAEKQRMLKKARLADQLNDQLSHRPGPLELIKKNILHTEENVETAVKSGTLSFRATCEGLSGRPEHPSSYLGPDESPTPSPQHPAPGKDKNRKKSKQKSQPKPRFKFHEYKGPPSAPRPPTATADDTPYDLLLQQQRLLLQLTLPASPSTSDCSDTAPSRLHDMKVSDLRAQCKRLGLPVSGPKQQLLDRLRPTAEVTSPVGPAPASPPDIVTAQRRQISELQAKLDASRDQLEAVRREAAGQTDQSRRLLHAHLCVVQLRQQLDALQAHCTTGHGSRFVLASADAAYLLPITILPSPAPAPVPPPPPPPPPPSVPPILSPPPSQHDDVHIMDDVLEILAEQGELPSLNEINHNSMSIPEMNHRPPSAMDITNFDDMEELSLPSFPDDRPELDLQEFGLDPTPSPGMAVDELIDTELLPNMFGRGHMPQCDPLLGGVIAPPPKPALKHFSWDKIEFDT